jgi:hypothetical protein
VAFNDSVLHIKCWYANAQLNDLVPYTKHTRWLGGPYKPYPAEAEGVAMGRRQEAHDP